MPGVSAGDRRILIIAGLAFLLLIVLGFLFAPASSGDTNSGTTYSASSNGAKAAFLLLQETGYHVERWQHAPPSLKPDEHTDLSVATPAMILHHRKKDAIDKLHARGRRRILPGSAGAGLVL